MGHRKSGLIRQVTSLKRFNSYEIFYDGTRKGWPFNTGDCLIELSAWAALTVYWSNFDFKKKYSTSLIFLIHFVTDIINIRCYRNKKNTCKQHNIKFLSNTYNLSSQWRNKHNLANKNVPSCCMKIWVDNKFHLTNVFWPSLKQLQKKKEKS